MTLAEKMTADVSDVFLNQEHFAESVTGTDTDGEPITFLAIVERDAFVEQTDDEGQRERHDAVLLCASSVAIDTEKPLTIGGEQFYVRGEPSRDPQMTQYTLERTTFRSIKVHRPERRRA